MGLMFTIVSCQKSGINNDNLQEKQKQVVSVEDLKTIGNSTAEIVSGFTFGQSSVVGNSLTDETSYQVFSSNNYTTFHSKSGGGKGGIKSKLFSVDGISVIANNDTLLAIYDFENINENIKNLHSFITGGGTVTHYDASGNVITGLNVYIPLPSLYSRGGKGKGGKNNTIIDLYNIDSLISTIGKTEINFGTGVSLTRGIDTVTRSGKIVITRTGTYPNTTQQVSFQSYIVNGIGLTGSKTITRTKTNVNDTSNTVNYSVSGNATLVFSDASTATIQLNKSIESISSISSTTGKLVGGKITTTASNTVTLSNNNVLYSYVTTTPVVEDLSCTTRKKPANGLITINYLTNLVTINFTGDCSSSTIIITINGVAYTRSI